MQTKVKITGMHCTACKKLIEDVASEIPGVTSCTVDPASGAGVIDHDDTFDFGAFTREIENLDTYKVEKILAN